MTLMRELLRIIVASIFIISGGVKAIDTKGFSFKLEEYFSPQVFNLSFFEIYVLPIAVLVVIFELILGFALLLKIKLKETLWLMIGMCIFFAFLTFYSAYYNVVTDCGCFGDAIKFTPWQSFWKDIVLLFALILLWFGYRERKGAVENKLKYIILSLVGIISIYIIVVGIIYEPIKDFRDYKIGVNLKQEKEKIAKNPSIYKTFYILKNKQTGEEKKINQDDYVVDESLWEEDSPWEIQSDLSTTELVLEGYKSEISKFKIEDSNGNDLTTEILNAPKVVLLFSYKSNEVSKEILEKMEEFVMNFKYEDRVCEKVYGVSTLPNVYKKIPNTTMDGTAIKTIARSNPFILVLADGKIVKKQGYREIIK